MKKYTLISLAIFGLVNIISCSKKGNNETSESSTQTKNQQISVEKIPYIVAKNYFVKNTYEKGTFTNPKITSEADFDKIFGMATTMGENGKPTPIDFSKQFAVAIIENPTDKNTDVSIGSVEKSNGKIAVHYSKKEGEKQSFTTQPFLLLVIENQYHGDVEVIKNK